MSSLQTEGHAPKWQHGECDQKYIDGKLWIPDPNLYQILIIDSYQQDVSVAAPRYYPVRYDVTQATPMDLNEITALLDIISDRTQAFSDLVDIDRASRGEFTREFQYSLILLLWRLILQPDAREYAGIVSVIMQVLQMANHQSAGLLINIRDGHGMLKSVITVIRKSSSSVSPIRPELITS